MSLELDHVFCFITPEADEAVSLERAGFVVAPQHDHAGQGTSNRRIFFPDNYLELIFLRDRNEAESNPLHLQQRADWLFRGGCPFGVVLRGEVPTAEKAQYWPYEPRYALGKNKMWIRKATANELFVAVLQPDGPTDSLRPKNRGDLDAGAFAHPNQAKGIVSVTVWGPELAGRSVAGGPANLEIRNHRGWLMQVELDGAALHRGRPNPALELYSNRS